MSADALDGRFELAREIARRAGLHALAAFGARDALTVESKGVQDRVTETDRSVQAMIEAAIRERFPGDGFLGEESDPATLPAETEGGLWVVDPIDGTDCFVFGLPSWCVSIAWMKGGRTRIGVIYDAVHDELFAAALGRGATVNGAPLSISGARAPSGGLVGIGYSLRVPPEATLAPLKRLMDGGGMFHRCGSGALSLAWVASGRLIGYFEPHMNAWDCLAGLLLVEEAGGWTSAFLDDGALARGNPVAAAAPGVVAHIQAISGLFGAAGGAQAAAV